MAVVHDSFRLPREKRDSLKRIPGLPWQVGAWSRFEGMVDGRYIFISADRASLGVFVAGGGPVTGIAPESFLPP